MSILLLPFKWISYFLGQHYSNNQLSPLVDQRQRFIAQRIGYIIKIVTRYTPWESKCFVEAVMARTLFYWYNIPYVLHFGVLLTKEAQNPMKAHAWTKVGSQVITGRKGHKAYSIVSTYVTRSVLPK